MALWSASTFGVVRCETNGKVEYRNPPCPEGTERPLGGPTGMVANPTTTPPPTARQPAALATPGTNAQREDENARFMQQERRLREERLRVEAERAQREAASKPADVAAETVSPTVVPAPPPPPLSGAKATTPAGGGNKLTPEKADRKPIAVASRDSSSKFGGVWLYLLPLAVVIVLAVVQTRRGNGSALRWTLAAIFGLLAGFLIYFIVAMVSKPAAGLGPLFVLLTLSAGWVVSTYALGNRAESWLRVLQRAFLLGAVQWLLVIPASWVWTGRAVVSTIEKQAPTVYGNAGAILGGGLIALLTGGVALFMLVCCATGYLIVYFVQRWKLQASSASTQEAEPI